MMRLAELLASAPRPGSILDAADMRALLPGELWDTVERVYDEEPRLRTHRGAWGRCSDTSASLLLALEQSGFPERHRTLPLDLQAWSLAKLRAGIPGGDHSKPLRGYEPERLPPALRGLYLQSTLQAHIVVRVGPYRVDMTARQFDANAPAPLVWVGLPVTEGAA